MNKNQKVKSFVSSSSFEETQILRFQHNLNQHPVFLDTQFDDAMRKNSLKRKYTNEKTFLSRVDDVINMIFVLDQSKEILEKSPHIE